MEPRRDVEIYSGNGDPLACAPREDDGEFSGHEDAIVAPSSELKLDQAGNKTSYPVVVVFGASGEGGVELANTLANDQLSPFASGEPNEIEMTIGRVLNPMNPTATIIKVPGCSEKDDPKFERIKLLESVLWSYPEASKTILVPMSVFEKKLSKHMIKQLRMLSALAAGDKNNATGVMLVLTKTQEYCKYKTEQKGDKMKTILQKISKKHTEWVKKVHGDKNLELISTHFMEFPDVLDPKYSVTRLPSFMVGYFMTPAELECYSIQKNHEINLRRSQSDELVRQQSREMEIFGDNGEVLGRNRDSLQIQSSLYPNVPHGRDILEAR